MLRHFNMIFSQSIKSVLRTPFKSLLFILLIIAVTAFACLGFGMYSSGNKLIAAADKAYTTKAVVEYIDDGYPDASKYSNLMIEELSAFDYSVLSDNKNVLHFERQYELGGYIEGFESRSRNKPHGQYGVLKFRYRGDTDYGPACMIHEAYYNGDYTYGDGTIVYLQDNKTALVEGHIYIAHGRFTKGYMNTDAFVLTPYQNSGAPQEKLFNNPIWDITDLIENDRYKSDKNFELFMKIVESYEAMDNFINVTPTADASSATPFLMQQTNLLEDGQSRFFTDEEYASGSKVIILSNYVAVRMHKSIGDTVRLNLYSGTEDGSFAKDSFWPDGVYLDRDDYTIVGLFKESNTINNLAFIPVNTKNADWLPERCISYTVANITLKNGTADEYIDTVTPDLLSAMRISVFDQGYSETIAPIKAMQQTAILLTIVSVVCCLVVLTLFAYLYVAKQKDTAKTMVALGTGRAKALIYLLLCVLIICVIASAIGAFIGYRLSEKVTEAAYLRAEQTTTVDNRFSAVYMNNDDVDFELSFTPEIKPLALVACGVTASAVILALITAFISLKKSAPKGGAQRVSIFKRLLFSFELAIKAIFRGGAKNIIVPVVSLVLILFIGIFARQIATSESRINDVYDNSNVYAYYTTVNGKRVDTLSLIDDDFKELIEDKHIDEVYPSSVRYMQICGHKQAGDEDYDAQKLDLPVIPSGGFARETFLNNLVNYNKVIFTESITHTPEFLFENELHIDYLEGYSEASFKGDECICALPATYMEEHGYKLGDNIFVAVFTTDIDEPDLDIMKYDAKIVATFEKKVSRNNLYMPLNFGKHEYYAVWDGRWATPYLMPINTPEEELELHYHYKHIEYKYTYNSLAFKLKDLRTLNEFKDNLSSMGYSPVGSFGRARTWLVVEDTFLNETIVSINRHVSYMAILFIVVYILAVAIGFVLSYLLTKSRRSELAMMRSMGTGMIRTFNIFFIEQFLLSLLGGAIGVGVVWLIYREILPLQWLGFAGYFICYWIGVMISVAVMNRVDVMKILSAKD